MHLKFTFTLLAATALVGCFNGESSPTAEKEAPIQKSRPELRTSGSGGFITGYAEVQSNGGGAVEKFADCPIGQVMTGFGGRVANDNFQSVTVYCRAVNADGSLSATQEPYSDGNGDQESQVILTPGKVAVAVGGIVTSGNLISVSIYGCVWNAATHTVDHHNCSYTHSGTQTTWENLVTAWKAAVTSSDSIHTVGAGAGMTSSSNNVFAVRMTAATLQ